MGFPHKFEPSYRDGRFFLENLDTNTTPFVASSAAGNYSIYLSRLNFVGMGTSLPLKNLHIQGNLGTTLRLEQTAVAGTGFPMSWDIQSGGNGLQVIDVESNTAPFIIANGAPQSTMVLQSSGRVALGHDSPEGILHTKGDGVQLAYFESGDGGAVQVRFRTDSENRRFLAVNNANEVKSQIVFGDNQIQFLGKTVAQEWLRISSAGIVSSGPTCNPNPCDATFDSEAFTVPPIEERAAYMWDNMHLPAIGPTTPEAPPTSPKKLGGVIHELESAHLYIGALHEGPSAEKLRNDRLEATVAPLAARLEALER